MTLPVFSTLGCRLNAYETEAMKELALAAGLGNAVIVNTCAVTAEAVRKARQEIRRLRREHPDATLIVTGCAAQTEPETFASMPEVTHVVGNSEKMRASTWAALQAPDLIGATERIQVDDIMSVRETAGHLIDGFRQTQSLCSGPERVRSPLHLLHHPLRSGQFAFGPCGGGGGADQAAGGPRLQRGGADRR